jgi:hypothetical protein
MKTIINFSTFTGFCFLFQIISAQEPRYEITGNISGAEGVQIFLEFALAGNNHTDTAIVSGNQFKIIGGKVEFPVMANLSAHRSKTSENGQNANRWFIPNIGFVNFFLENSKIEVTAEFDSIRSRVNFKKIEGSQSNDEYNTFSPPKDNNSLRPRTPKYGTSSYKAYKDSLGNVQKIHTKEFIKKHPHSYVIPYILQEYCFLTGVRVENLDSLINILDPEIMKTPDIERIKSFIRTFKNNAQQQSNGEPPKLWIQEVNEKAGTGGKDLIMKFEETEHGENFSIVKITSVSGPSVAKAMFVAQGFYRIALLRGKQFYISLKSWKDAEGNLMEKVGFFDTEDTDLRKTFGSDISEEIDKKRVMSVIQEFAMFGEK